LSVQEVAWEFKNYSLKMGGPNKVRFSFGRQQELGSKKQGGWDKKNSQKSVCSLKGNE